MRLLLGGFCLLPALLSGQRLADSSVAAAPAPISLSWRRFDVDLTGPARPWGYVSAIGRRAVVLGTETGSFEAWAWPLKLLHGFELAFKSGADFINVGMYDFQVGEDVALTREVVAKMKRENA